jgi:hypothetical protein
MTEESSKDIAFLRVIAAVNLMAGGLFSPLILIPGLLGALYLIGVAIFDVYVVIDSSASSLKMTKLVFIIVAPLIIGLLVANFINQIGESWI